MKAKFRKTGEIVDIISWSSNTTRNDVLDYVSYIDSNGIEHPNVKGLNFYWDFESIDLENRVKILEDRVEYLNKTIDAIIRYR